VNRQRACLGWSEGKLPTRALPVALILAALTDPAPAAERELEDAPAPTSAREIESPLERAFLRPARKEPLLPWVEEQLEELPPFFADTEIDARFRTYYLRKDRTIDRLSEAWAMGGSISYRSGWLADFLSVEAEFFTSHPIVAPGARDGTQLLAPGQESYSVVAVANAKLRYQGVVLTGYRQTLGLPYLNRSDSRMTPYTFEGLTLAKDEGTIQFSTGYLWKIKLRNSDEFISMARKANPLLSKDRGLAYAGVLFRPNDDFHVGASAGVVPDLFAGIYSETSYARDLSAAVEMRFDAQVSYQQSVGSELLLVLPSFKTWNLGLRVSTSAAGAMFRLGFSITGDERAILSPYGSNPSYVDLMQRTFTGADEKALLLSFSYDFSQLGVSGLSVIVNFVEAWGGDVPGIRGDARELDATIDYRLPKELGIFEGLWLRMRGSWLDDETSDKNGSDFRVILRYDFPVV